MDSLIALLVYAFFRRMLPSPIPFAKAERAAAQFGATIG